MSLVRLLHILSSITLLALLPSLTEAVYADDPPSDPPITEAERAERLECRERYTKQVWHHIRRKWVPVKTDHSGVTKVLFLVEPDGTLTYLKLTLESGYSDMDQAAIKAVERSSPYKPLPPKCQFKPLKVEMTFEQTFHARRYFGPLGPFPPFRPLSP